MHLLGWQDLLFLHMDSTLGLRRVNEALVHFALAVHLLLVKTRLDHTQIRLSICVYIGIDQNRQTLS